MLTQEFIAGAMIISAGCLSMYLMQCKWYREWMFSGYWKRYNTPSGLFWGQLQNLMVIGLGIAICSGLVEFNK